VKKRIRMKLLHTSIVLFVLTNRLVALDDTPENRAKAADRYLQVVPVQERMAEIVDKLALYLPAPQRELFKSAMTKHLDFKAVIQATERALIKTFTADELQAMSDFNSTPNGKCISKKLGSYMDNLMPSMQLEATKAAQAAEQDIEKGPADR
jgi:hypothetical protein